MLEKMKKFNKIQTELKLVNSILKYYFLSQNSPSIYHQFFSRSRDVMASKKAKAANNPFSEALAALNESTNRGKGTYVYLTSK